MQETEPEEITYENKRKRQLVFILLVGLSPILLWLFAYAYARTALSLKIARLEAAGIPTTPESLQAQAEAALPEGGDPNGKRIVKFFYGLKKENFKTSEARKSTIPLFHAYLSLNDELFSQEWDDAIKSEAKTVLDENTELLASAREIIGLPLMHPSSAVVYTPPRMWEPEFPIDLSGTRGISSLLQLQSMDAAYRGDIDAAVDIQAQLHQYIRHYDTMPPSILNVMIGCALRGMAYRNIALLLQNFPMRQKQYEKIAALIGEAGPVYRMRDAIKISRIHMVMGYKAYASGQLNPEHFPKLTISFFTEYRLPPVRPYLLMDEAAMLDGIVVVEKVMQGLDEHPWDCYASLKNQDFTKTWLPYPFADVQIQTYAGCVRQDLSCEAIRRLTLLTVALKMDHVAHAAYPESLEKLAPAFLETLPIDPFDGEPLKYIKTDTAFKVWSVGDNLVDDGGDRDIRYPGIIGYGGDIVLELAK